MNLNNFTLKAQESVQQAFNIAGAKGQQAVECAHILKGVMIVSLSEGEKNNWRIIRTTLCRYQYHRIPEKLYEGEECGTTP